MTAPRSADIYGAGSPSGTQGGGPWYGPYGSLGPEPSEYRATKPPMPIKPRGERGNKWLRYLLGILILVLAVGGSAFAITWFLDDDDDQNSGQPGSVQAQVTPTATVTSAAPAATQTPETLAEPTATSATIAEPTATSGAAPEPSPTSEPASQQVAPPAESDTGGSEAVAADFLPDVSDLGGDWIVQAEGERSQAEVGEALGEGGEDTLVQLGWQANLFRDFNREVADDETFFISISVHQFATSEGASEALAYFSQVLASTGLYQDAAEVTIGDASVAMEGTQSGANLYALYVLDGNILVRFGGSSLMGDPAPYVNTVAAQIIDGA
ncbi:MAG: hypothetical protein R2839_10950 [Thermomicrobiales bacterium]